MERQRQELVFEPHVAGMLKALGRPVYVVAIAEDWCGDVVRHVPLMQKMADTSPNLSVRYISREQHLDVFVRYLTNGGESIPKFVFLSDQFVECGNWGPMQESGRRLIARGKACGDVGAARKLTGAIYDAGLDRREAIAELSGLIDIASSEAP